MTKPTVNPGLSPWADISQAFGLKRSKDEDVTNFTPSTISVSATTPIAYVTLDLGKE